MAEPATDGDDYALHRQLAVVDVVTPISHSFSNSDCASITPFSSPFFLPHGWVVHQVPRSDGLRFDKYYIETETGRKFRSRNEVKRYLNITATRSRPLRLDYRIKNSSDQKMITSGEIMTTESNCSKFNLPEDWFVEKVPRKSGGTIDKYYHDPETGQRFRSLKHVERYLTEGTTQTKSSRKRLKYHENHLKSCGSRKKRISSRKMLDYEEDKDNQYQLVNITSESFPSTSNFELPDGWIVEEVPRKTDNHVDRYYYEPGSGRKFRSLVAVQKHLSEVEENSPLSVVLEELREKKLPLSKAFKLGSSIKNHGSSKKNISKKDEAASFLKNPPNKINWVLADSCEDTWNAFVGNKLVPNSLKQQWGKKFILAIHDTKRKAPISA